MTILEFADRFIRVPLRGTRGQYARMDYHPKQLALLNAIDERTDDGLRRYREFVASWIKKAGKSTTLATIGLYGLVGDDVNGEDREIVVASSDLAQSKDIVFTTCERMIRRNAWLSQHCRIKHAEIIYTEQVTNERTGGVYKVRHVLRAVPRDPKGLHGLNQSTTILDEWWSQDDYALLEALTESPWRPSPITVYGSYSGLKSQQIPGNPFYDLMQRALGGAEPQLYLSHISGPEAWREIPWHTQAWVEQQRKKLPPARFTRMIENRPATADTLFLDATAIAEAVAAHEPTEAGPNPALSYVAALDLGLSKDWAALVIATVDGLSRHVPAVVRFWRPEKGKRLSLVAIEDEVTALVKQYQVRKMVCDQWQAVAFAERLKIAGIQVELRTLGQAQLDRLAGLLKGAFKDRLITIPTHPPELREQLEALGEEEMKAANRKRDLVRFQSGSGAGAAAHDDLAVALAMTLELTEGLVGVPVMPPQSGCNEAERPHGHPEALRHCFLLGGDSFLMGSGCWTCPGRCASDAQHQAWRRRQLEHAADDQERDAILAVDLREFTRRFMKPSIYVAARRAERAFMRADGYC